MTNTNQKITVSLAQIEHNTFKALVKHGAHDWIAKEVSKDFNSSCIINEPFEQVELKMRLYSSAFSL